VHLQIEWLVTDDLQSVVLGQEEISANLSLWRLLSLHAGTFG
jgi:hypothetical protein